MKTELLELLKEATTVRLMEANPELVKRIMQVIAKAEGR